jgi:type II secretory pathway pseudopilin PulG
MLTPFRVVIRDRTSPKPGDEGVTLIEVVVAMGIVVVSLLALLGEFTTYLHQQRTQRAHAYALRVATTTLEDARRLPAGSLPTGATTSPPQPHDGIAYTTTTHVDSCDPTNQATCVSKTGTGSVARVSVTVSWSDSSGAHHLDLSTADADTHLSTVTGSDGGLTNNTTGATGTSVSLSSSTVSPTSVSVDNNGHPLSDVTLNLVVSGLASTTNISTTWTDDSGTHHATLTNTSGNTWSVVVPKSQITRTVAGGATGTVTFTATVPGLTTLPTSTLTAVPLPALSNCHVTVAPIVLVPLTRRTSLPEVLSCSATGLVGTDTVTATYASGTGTGTVSMTSGDNGATWSKTLPAGTTMVNTGSTEALTITLTRVSDSYTASTNLTVALA